MSDRLAAAIGELVASLREELRTDAEVSSRAPDRLLAIPEAAARMSIGRTLLYDLIGRGEVRTLRAGRRVLVPESAVAAWIEEKAGPDRDSGPAQEGDDGVRASSRRVA
jgi:excisionase family DNA binding protein